VGFSQLFQVMLSFGCVIALMFGLSYLVKRFGLEKKWQVSRSRSGLLSVSDSLFLDAKRRIVVIALQQKHYVILLDGERATVVDTLENGVLQAHEDIKE
jgi:flagellar biogenesis protein FliO